MNRMRKCNDEVYQLAKVQALVKKRSASVNHVVTSVASAVSNCNTHKCSIARRHEMSIRYFAMSIAKHLIWLTSLTVTSAGRNT